MTSEQYRDWGAEKVEGRPNMENVREILRKMLKRMSEEINHSLGDVEGDQIFVDENCRVDMKSFKEVFGNDCVLGDLDNVDTIEKGFYGADNENREDYYRRKFWKDREDKLSNEEMKLAWQREKEETKAGQLEMIMTILLRENLGGRFLIVRASDYDDYMNGADNLIIDKETGEVVCAFDDFSDAGRGDRGEKKRQRIKEKVKRGGSFVKYGITFRGKGPERREMKHLPIFYLSMDNSEMDGLIRKIYKGGENTDFKTKEDREIIQRLLNDILIQKEEFLRENLHGEVKGRLVNIDRIISAMRELVK